MWEWLTSTPAQLALGIVVLLILCLAAYRYVLSLRDLSNGDISLADEVARNFEEMRLGGDLSEAEFRNIKSVLGKKQVSEGADVKKST